MDKNPYELIIENSSQNSVFLFFQSDGVLAFISFAKIVLIFLTIFFLVHSVYLLYRTLRLQGKIKAGFRSLEKYDTKKYKGEFCLAWEAVLKRLKKGGEADLKLAIIEADKMFDNLLKRIMIKGEDMGERLNNIPKDLLPSVSKVWESHKIRNRLVHEPDFHLTLNEVNRLIKNYEVALKELEIL